MKKICLTILLLFCFSFPANSDSVIKDFKIDGIGLGDSLLDYFTMGEIFKSLMSNWDSYPSHDGTFKQVGFVSIYHNFDYVDFFIKADDNEYLTHSVGGRINYDNDLEGCFRKKDEIINQSISMFNNIKRKDFDNVPYSQDSSGESVSYITVFDLPTGVQIKFTCDSYGSNFEKEFGLIDNFNVTIDSLEFRKWAYIN